VDGVIHYVQAFCFRQIEDMIVRQRLKTPILTLEGDRPGPLDARTRIRLEGFTEMLKARKP
jgi:benzoyl-CoA reductase/2-hydroxyglutaryl-CoA dehydratase subunit BcrC/BadD/HgdB